MNDAAVIDVGSNSVRLVLYRLEGRAVWTVFNEKVLAGLGREIAATGRLSRDGVNAAMTALKRFKALLDGGGPTRVFAAATAAVRDAADGDAFCRRVRDEIGLELRVLSGKEEARYSALGVVAGAPDAAGLVGDLGGASLELIRLADGEPADGVTLPLGPFAMEDAGRFDADRTRAAAAKIMAPFAGRLSSDTLNAVGGAWRSLAILHMRMHDYPLEIVHQYEMSRREALDAARIICRQSKSSLDRIEGISRRRLDTLPHAAAVLEALIETLDVQKVVMSAFGLREGLLYESMSRETRAGDPLVEGCAALGARQGVSETLGPALETWLAEAFATLPPVFGERDPVLLAAACRLADLGARLHPDHRADLLFEQVLRAPISGMDHAERVFLACAAFARHTAANVIPEQELVTRLLSHDRYQRARALGSAIRLACDLSGRSPHLLAHSRIELKPGSVIVRASEAWAGVLLGEQTAKRGATLAGLLDRELKLRSTPEAQIRKATAAA
ncbi:MAG TPA: Ppx/GppA phosphatase family protein [Caulobacteraceae bacterium]|nr:Ppx/GppA phosphatase family protein [Caulobacteraceae bacterium]